MQDGLDLSDEFGVYDGKNEIDDDTILYHIISYDHLINVIKNREFVLRRVDTWQDTCEAMVSKIPLIFEGKPKHINFTGVSPVANIYASCWTDADEKAAMWNDFSSDKMGVRIGVRAKQLKKSILQLLNRINQLRDIASVRQFHERCDWIIANKQKFQKQSNIGCLCSSLSQNECRRRAYVPLVEFNYKRLSNECRLNKVQYLTEEEFDADVCHFIERTKTAMSREGDVISISCVHLLCMSMEALNKLMIKRYAFDSESEVRLLVSTGAPICRGIKQTLMSDNLKSLKMQINPLEFIESVTLNPYLADVVAQGMGAKIDEALNKPGLSVKSTLHTRRKYEIFVPYI